jgi:hypothetical protein
MMTMLTHMGQKMALERKSLPAFEFEQVQNPARPHQYEIGSKRHSFLAPQNSKLLPRLPRRVVTRLTRGRASGNRIRRSSRGMLILGFSLQRAVYLPKSNTVLRLLAHGEPWRCSLSARRRLRIMRVEREWEVWLAVREMA